MNLKPKSYWVFRPRNWWMLLRKIWSLMLTRSINLKAKTCLKPKKNTNLSSTKTIEPPPTKIWSTNLFSFTISINPQNKILSLQPSNVLLHSVYLTIDRFVRFEVLSLEGFKLQTNSLGFLNQKSLHFFLVGFARTFGGVKWRPPGRANPTNKITQM